ncbi:MAG: flagellar biosynthesis protein FlhB [Clostridiaceae bacterium]|jgi:flagellar biosynthetic protein FlhB|nr:flagellar biosynthesis protein FlhB [Clostridiaceae bacterium]
MIYKLNLQLFASPGAGGGEKTEKATPKKRREARKKGQVFQSREISSALVLLFIFIGLKVFGNTIYTEIRGFTIEVLTEYPKLEDLFMPDVLARVFIDGAIVFFKCVGPILLIALLSGIIISYAQVGFLFTIETLKPQLSRISPINGFKRLFSMQGLVNLLKSILKVIAIGYITYVYLNGKTHAVLSLMDMDLIQISSFIAATVIDLAIRICVVLIVLGIFDFAYQWWQYEKEMKMTKQEVKEEYKQVEGNPEIKGKIRQKQRQMSMRRMMQEVPKADVIITNPTHFACALKYDADESPAPMLLAKGQDYVAIRIKEIAKEAKVEIVENKQLARAIYDTVDIGQEIPQHLYQAVAEVLAFVYSLKGKTKAG